MTPAVPLLVRTDAARPALLALAWRYGPSIAGPVAGVATDALGATGA